ncbi:MAG: hypothetical protein QXR85_02710 [Candidatus Micrarchaeaceae archaeon]
MELKTYFIYKEKEVGAISTLEGALSKLGIKKSNSSADLIVAIGGDGTFLRAAAKFNESLILPLRYKTHFGTLLNYDFENMRIPLEKISSGNFFVKREPLIEASVSGRKFLSAGDFYFQRGREGSALRYNVVIKNGKSSIHISAVGDGFIVCTPLGSTGYFSYYDKLLGRKPRRIRGFGFAHILPCSISARDNNGIDMKPKLKLMLKNNFDIKAFATRQLDQFLYSSSFKSYGIRIKAGEVMHFRRSKKTIKILI